MIKQKKRRVAAYARVSTDHEEQQKGSQGDRESGFFGVPLTLLMFLQKGIKSSLNVWEYQKTYK